MASPQLTAAHILRHTHLLKRLSTESLDLLVTHAHVRRLAKGERVFSQGDECPGLYCVGTGLVRIFKLAPTGKEHVLHLAEEGQTFGEVAAILGTSAPAHAEAVRETTCAVLPATTLSQVLQSHHALSLELLTGMAAWVKRLVGLLEDLVLRDASGRVAHYLLEAMASTSAEPRQEEISMKEVRLKALKKDLASHLNLTSETLSRTLRRLADAGIIEQTSAQSVRVLDVAQLEAVANGLLPAEWET